MSAELPLTGVRVLDFSTLLPGPLATLLLAEAGAEVTKVERPGRGDEMRGYAPRLGADSANFVLLNRGKGSVTVDLRRPEGRRLVLERARDCDVWVEQNRPGVMRRLGLGYEDVRAVNPGIVYCSITGYGQTGPDAGRAGHDLNYLAESGLLGDAVDEAGAPHLPPTVIADIAGGAYPAVINILLALRRRQATGQGGHIDVSMTHNLTPLAYSALATRAGSDAWPEPGRSLLSGGSPRYALYRTADDRFLAAAPLEQRFWERFAALVGLEERWWADEGREAEVRAEVARLVRARTAEDWERTFDGEDVCCSVVASFAEAARAGRLLADTAYQVAGDGGAPAAALGVPLVPGLRGAPGLRRAPGLRSAPPFSAPSEPTPAPEPALRAAASRARALHVTAFGQDASGLEVVPAEPPAPGDGEVVVAVRAAGVNFPDVLVAEGRYQNLPPLPFVPGKELVGVVVDRGPGVRAPELGTRVSAQVEHGAFATHVAVPAAVAVPVPDELGDEAAAALAMGPLTAHFALHRRARLAPGETVLVTGATGDVGSAAVQLAAGSAARVVAHARRPDSEPWLRALGATDVVTGDPGGLRDQVRGLTGGRGADVVVETVGGEVCRQAVRCTAWEGRLVVCGFAGGEVPQLHAGHLLVKNIAVLGLQVSDYRDREPATLRRVQDELLRTAAAGGLHAPVAARFPLERLSEALDVVRRGGRRGKVLLTIDEAPEPR